MHNHLVLILLVGLALAACQSEIAREAASPLEEVPIEEPIATLPPSTETPRLTPTFTAEDDNSIGIVLFVLAPEFDYREYEGIRHNLERLGYRVIVTSTTSDQPVGFDEVHRYEARPPTGDMPEVAVNLLFEDVRVEDYDAIVFISDPSWFTGESSRAVDLAREAADADLVLGGMGTAVSVLARAQLLEGVRVTGLTCEQMETVYGAICTWSTVESDGRIVTGDVSYPCRHFAEAIVEAIQEDL
jgi:hypothetical protein